MKKLLALTGIFLSAVTLAACGNQAATKKTTASSSVTKSEKASSKKAESSSKKSASSSKEASTSSQEKSSGSLSERFNSLQDDRSSLRAISDWQNDENFHKFSSLVPAQHTLTVNGEQIGGAQSPTNYEQLVTLFGQPVAAAGEEDVKLVTWDLGNASLTAMISNDTITMARYSLKDEGASLDSIKFSDVSSGQSAQEVIKKLGAPSEVTIASMGTSFSWKSDSKYPYSIMFSKDKARTVMSPQELERSAKILAPELENSSK